MAKQYAMVIDLHRCVGCAACDIACKSENNVPTGIAWSSHTTWTSGTFPNTRWQYVPTLCNHCSDAPCVEVCPTTAMHKSSDGMTLHDADECIGCRACEIACPYGVISFNEDVPHAAWRDSSTLVQGATSTGEETASKSGQPFPHYNPERAATYDGVRRKGIVEKCTFCDHRVGAGEQPWCVVACPADARIFGDLNDSGSEVRQLVQTYQPMVLKKEAGTTPNVFYIRQFNTNR